MLELYLLFIWPNDQVFVQMPKWSRLTKKKLFEPALAKWVVVLGGVRNPNAQADSSLSSHVREANQTCVLFSHPRWKRPNGISSGSSLTCVFLFVLYARIKSKKPTS
jgi:hypothetical protein